MKTSTRNHIYVLQPFLFSLSGFIGGLYFLFIRKHGFPEGIVLDFTVLLISAIVLPLVYIHFDYMINDLGSSLRIDLKNKKGVYKKGKTEIPFSFEDIECVSYFGETRGFNNLPVCFHSFLCFKLKNNNHFIISCLVVRDIEKVIPNLRIVKHRRLFPSISLERMLP